MLISRILRRLLPSRNNVGFVAANLQTAIVAKGRITKFPPQAAKSLGRCTAVGCVVAQPTLRRNAGYRVQH